MKTKLVISAVFALALASSPARADNETARSRTDAALAQIKAAFGFVPAFTRAVPSGLLPSWWQLTTDIDAEQTALDGKTKELIGLAVAAQIPCEMCIYYHTQAARLRGATDQEIREAVFVAGTVRLNSTVVNGAQVDRAQFRRDVDRIVKGARQQAAKR